MLSARNSLRKHKDWILALLQALMFPTQAAIIYSRNLQREASFVSQGFESNDWTAKQDAQLWEPEQVMALVICPPELSSLPRYSPKKQENSEKQAIRKEIQASIKWMTRF